MCNPPPLSPSVRIPPLHSVPAPERARLALSHWKKIAGPWHLRLIQEGIPLEWIAGPPSPNRLFDSALGLKGRQLELQACRDTLEHYLEIGSIRALLDQADTTGVWMSFFPVAKKGTSKMRGCMDARYLNQHLMYHHFKMEGVHTLQSVMHRRDYMTKFDLSDFYMHLPMPPESVQYFRFMFEGVKYECLGMPFGLGPAPRIATKFLSPVVKYLRRRGVRCIVYIDDILILSRSREKAIKHTQLALDLFHRLGFQIHPKKIQATPTQSIEFLGLQVNSVRMQLRVPREKIRSLRRQISDTISQSARGSLTVRRFASLLGKFNAVRGAVSSAPLHIWPLIHLQHSVLRRRSDWETKMTLSVRAVEELQWWAQDLQQWNGRSVIPQKHQFIMTTDASHLGWGGWWKPVGRCARPSDQARGFFSKRESRNSSNWRELTAVDFTLKSAAHQFQNKVLLIETDNNTTKAYINHMGGRSRVLSAIAHSLWKTAQQWGISLIAVHRPGRLNERADRLSRWKKDSTDIKLRPTFFHMANRRWGPHTVDLFASRLNKQLPRFVSWKPEPQAAAQDGMMFPLKGENPWCFPPEALIGRLLSRIIREQATITLVAPLWPSKPWWPDLQALRIDRPIILPHRDDTVQSVGLNQFSAFRHLKLAIWRISGVPSKISGYQMSRSH